MMFSEALITPWRYVATRRSSVLDRAHDGAVVDVKELDGVVLRVVSISNFYVDHFEGHAKLVGNLGIEQAALFTMVCIRVL